MDYFEIRPGLPPLDITAIESNTDQLSISIVLTAPSTGLGV